MFFFLMKEKRQSDENWDNLIKLVLYRMMQTKCFNDAIGGQLHELFGDGDSSHYTILTEKWPKAIFKF